MQKTSKSLNENYFWTIPKNSSFCGISNVVVIGIVFIILNDKFKVVLIQNYLKKITYIIVYIFFWFNKQTYLGH